MPAIKNGENPWGNPLLVEKEGGDTGSLLGRVTRESRQTIEDYVKGKTPPDKPARKRRRTFALG